jgi:prepilin-type N-terminal cleavage/methylation domain-containing protein
MSGLPSPRRRLGFTLLELLVVIAIIGMLIGLTMPAVQKVRESANRVSCGNNLHQLSLAMRHYELIYDSLPPRAFSDEAGASWAVLIMPYMEQEPLYNRWDLSKSYYDQNYDARQNSVPNYFCPSRRTASSAGLSVSGDQRWLGCQNFGPNVPGALGDYAACIGTDVFG